MERETGQSLALEATENGSGPGATSQRVEREQLTPPTPQ